MNDVLYEPYEKQSDKVSSPLLAISAYVEKYQKELGDLSLEVQQQNVHSELLSSDFKERQDFDVFSYTDELEYNKQYLHYGITIIRYALFPSLKESKEQGISYGQDFEEILVSNKMLLRNVIEAYIKLKTRYPDELSALLKERNMPSEELENIFDTFVSFYIEQYQQSLSEKILFLDKYLKDKSHEEIVVDKNKSFKEFMKEFFLGKKKREQKERIQQRKQEKLQIRNDEQALLYVQEVLDYYMFKSFSGSQYSDAYCLHDFVSLQDLELALGYYALFSEQAIAFLTDALPNIEEIKKDPTQYELFVANVMYLSDYYKCSLLYGNKTDMSSQMNTIKSLLDQSLPYIESIYIGKRADW